MSSKNNVDILIINASELLTCKPFDPKKPKIGEDLKDLGIIKDGALGIKSGKIVHKSVRKLSTALPKSMILWFIIILCTFYG